MPARSVDGRCAGGKRVAATANRHQNGRIGATAATGACDPSDADKTAGFLSRRRSSGARLGAIAAGRRAPLPSDDAYDAMTTTRPYREAISERDALAELRSCAGRQFDPAVVAAFERVIARGRLGSLERIAA
jgi:hypothetical protein